MISFLLMSDHWKLCPFLWCLSTEPALGIVLNVAVGLTLVFLSFLSLSFWFYG